MRRNDTGTPKKKTRRAAGQMVASAVMALAIAVGGFGTTALLASQPAGLTVEPSALLWEGESNAAHSTKKDDKKEAPKPSETDSASSEAESTAASAAQPAAPSQNETEAPAVSEAPAAPAEETAAAPAAPEAAPADPMMGSIEELEQENNFPSLQQETEALAAEDPLSAPVEQAAEAQPEAGAETNSEETALPVKTEEGTILLTPEEIRAALDAGTLDESSIDPACLTDENGLLSWLWNLLFGRSDKDDSDSGSSTPAPVYSGWRTVGGKTYYYDQYTNQPVKGIQSIDNKLYYFDANGVQQNATFGIDVSKYQSSIDWEQVKTAGVKFVIIRIGYRGYGSGALVLDPMFEQHFTNARNAGLKVGVYFFSQAVNEEEAREEAMGCAYVLNGRKLDYPIYFDTEASGRQEWPRRRSGRRGPHQVRHRLLRGGQGAGLQARRLRFYPVVPPAGGPEPSDGLQHLERTLRCGQQPHLLRYVAGQLHRPHPRLWRTDRREHQLCGLRRRAWTSSASLPPTLTLPCWTARASSRRTSRRPSAHWQSGASGSLPPADGPSIP